MYCRTSAAAISGAAAGILGLTGLNGFAFFLISLALTDAGDEGWNNYFAWRQIWFDARHNWRPTYLCTLMDFSLWYGTCVLRSRLHDHFVYDHSILTSYHSVIMIILQSETEYHICKFQ